MKVLVNEVEKDALIRVKDYFIKDDEIMILEDASIEFKSADCDKPYYINENIEDINKLIETCHEFDYSKSAFKKSVSFDDFCGFNALTYSIYKQRFIGIKVNDLEYLYEKYKEKFDIKLANATSLNKWFSGDFDVIFGESEIGEMYLYKLNEYFDFVFLVIHEKKGLFGKSKKVMSHWHPGNFLEAGEDMEKFLSNSVEMAKLFEQ